jgi:arylsulfatase A-like enzyme
MARLSRRDFLKFSALLPAALAASRLTPGLLQPSRPNVILVLFDAMSARNLSLYGYPRRTTPNLERFAQRATVFHHHHSAGNFTVPGTASLLTGLYPWTHRAINMAGLMKRSLTDHNLFRTVSLNYHRIAFSQNLWANHIFNQFAQDLDSILPPDTFAAFSQVIGKTFQKDLNAAYRTTDDFLFQDDDPPASLLAGLYERLAYQRKLSHLQTHAHDYPLGLPTTGLLPIAFRLDHLFQGLASLLPSLPKPFIAYCHLWSVHEPYRPHSDFFDRFKNDNFSPPDKPRHPLGGKNPPQKIINRRKLYDEYIASADHYFGLLLDTLETSGLLDNSYLILTADHGECFERGTLRHITPLLFEPLVHIPLLISAPGQRQRLDVYTPTNSVDLLPTLAACTGNPIPAWAEGRLLPTLGGESDPQRVSFSVEAKGNSSFERLRKVSVAMYKGPYKITYYTSSDYDFFELYNLEDDPEELNNLIDSQPGLAKDLQTELLQHLQNANAPYSS